MTKFTVDVPVPKEPKAPREHKPKPPVHPGLTIGFRCLGCGDWLDWTEDAGFHGQKFAVCLCGLWASTLRGVNRIMRFIPGFAVELGKEVR